MLFRSAKDELTVELPGISFSEFDCKLMAKWKIKLQEADKRDETAKQEKLKSFEELGIMHKKWHDSEITEDEYYAFKENLRGRI